MTPQPNELKLTPEERALYAGADRESPLDDREEERTVAALRARGLLFAPSRSRSPRYPAAIIGAAAAVIVAVLGVAGVAIRSHNTEGATTSPAPPESTVAASAPAPGEQTTRPASSFLAWY